jgi:hypothetical protein
LTFGSFLSRCHSSNLCLIFIALLHAKSHSHKDWQVKMKCTEVIFQSQQEVIGDFFLNNLDWGPVPHFCPLEALQPVWLMPEPYCTTPCFSKCSYSGHQLPLASITHGSPLAARGGTMGEKKVARWCLGYVPRVLLHAANLQHGTDNFTSLPKEGVLRTFIAL